MSRPTQQDVLLAILAMDAYSRGARGTEKLMETSEDKLSTSVGTATFIRSNVDIPSLSASLSSGFSASEYSLGGGSKVISYRGTDFPQGFRDGAGWSSFILDAAAAAATIFRGITSISLATQAVNATTPSGNRLLDKASDCPLGGALSCARFECGGSGRCGSERQHGSIAHIRDSGMTTTETRGRKATKRKIWMLQFEGSTQLVEAFGPLGWNIDVPRHLRDEVTIREEDALITMARGFPLPPGVSPPSVLSIFISIWEPPKNPRFPDIFSSSGGRAPCVKGSFAALLQRFNLGESRFYPVELRRFDKTTVIPGEFFLFHIPAVTDAFVPEKNPMFKYEELPPPYGNFWRRPPMPRDTPIVLDESKLPDPSLNIWRDRMLDSRIFVSDRLMQALKEIGLTRRLSVGTCAFV